MILNSAQRKLLFLSSLGGVLEFYDFIIYALLANYIAKEFFPTGNDVTSLITTFATFTVGYLVRPIGGMLFGHFGDKLGRKATFTFSILLMALATLAIGFVPPYRSIGIAAPLILTTLRILQGLSVGGEIPGAIAYVSESIPEKKGLACGIIFFSLTNGIVLGSLILAISSTWLSEQQMLAWGWRVPFFIGGLFGLFSYCFRRRLEESSLFVAIEHQVEAFPMLTVLRDKFINCLAATFIVGLGASIISLLFLFIPAYLTNILHIVSASYLWYKTLAVFVAAVLCIGFGMLADKMNHKALVIILALLTIALSYPIFMIYAHYFPLFIIALLFSALLTGLAWGVIPSLLAELFPTKIRYSGVALSYNLGFAIFGGLTPLIASVLVYESHSAIAPAIYLIVTAVLAVVALLFVRQDKLQ